MSARTTATSPAEARGKQTERSRIAGITQLAEQVLELPVTIGKTTCISGLKNTLDQPEFASAIGLVKFGSFKHRRQEERPSFVKNIKHVFNRLMPR